MDGAARLLIRFDCPTPGSIRVEHAGIAADDRLAHYQRAFTALGEVIERLGGSTGVEGLAEAQVCAWGPCSKLFRPSRADAVYCGERCKQAAWRLRRRERVSVPPPVRAVPVAWH